MDHSNTIHSFAAVIGDIKDSRHLENRKEVQIRLQRILDRLNEAQQTIYRCYQELQDLGVVVVKEKAASGN